MVVVSWYRQLWRIKSTFIVILTPLICLPVPILFNNQAGKCAYAILIMAIYWVSEVIPMAVTALLPVVIMPWLGIMDTKNVCSNYLKDANMLFFGGLMVAVAVEKWNLHKRIALRVLLLVGSEPRWLMFGFMATTAFLSMWISNTATTAMMIPIANAVLTELDEHRRGVKEQKQEQEQSDCLEAEQQTMMTSFIGSTSPTITAGLETDTIVKSPNGTPPNVQLTNHERTCHPGNSNKVANQCRQANGADSKSSKTCYSPAGREKMLEAVEEGKVLGKDMADEEEVWFARAGKGMRLCIAYAANIGGTATLTGTGPNLVLKGQLDLLYKAQSGINFSSWFVFAFPNMLISLILAWFWLMIMFMGPSEIVKFCRSKKKTTEKGDNSTSDVITREYKKLGNMSFAEAAVLVHFIILALLWLTRDPEFVPGWGSLLPKKYVTDSCVAITISLLLFIVPSRWPNYLCFRRKGDVEEPDVAPALLDWPTVHKNIPWNVLLLLGGGFALADACKVSGLSSIIGEFFITFRHMPVWVLALVLSTLTAAFTEFTSNVATATIFLPILAVLVKLSTNTSSGVTVSASFAFMLPVATPPNAIVFAYGNMKILDMIKAGFIMNIICLLVLQLAINTWAYSYFHLGTFPEWAGSPINSTMGLQMRNFTSSEM